MGKLSNKNSASALLIYSITHTLSTPETWPLADGLE